MFKDIGFSNVKVSKKDLKNVKNIEFQNGKIFLI